MDQRRAAGTVLGQSAVALMMCGAAIVVIIVMLQIADRALGSL